MEILFPKKKIRIVRQKGKAPLEEISRRLEKAGYRIAPDREQIFQAIVEEFRQQFQGQDAQILGLGKPFELRLSPGKLTIVDFSTYG